MARVSTSSLVAAKEAVVITVGARPPVYEYVTVIHNKTGQPVKIPKDEPKDPGDFGVPYSFKAGQKVARSHDAVRACPGAFAPVDEVEDLLER